MGEGKRRIGQEGSRWFNEPPTGEELAKWFADNVPLHEGLNAADYIPGITLIPGTEKAREVTGYNPDGEPLIAKRENLIYTPYAKVETRVKYFHDLMANNQEEWLGAIEPVTPMSADKRLPPGFFLYFIQTGHERGHRYICCTMKVSVFDRKTLRWEQSRNVKTGEMEYQRVGTKIIDAPPATKMIPLTTMGWGENRGERVVVPDDFALMKAETGAVGRALGLAGMLVIPGTGVATAEDMGEVERLENQPQMATSLSEAPTEESPLPSTQESDSESLDQLRKEAADAINTLKDEQPDSYRLFQQWAQERGIGKLAEIEDQTVLRGLATKARRDYEAAEQPPDTT